MDVEGSVRASDGLSCPRCTRAPLLRPVRPREGRLRAFLCLSMFAGALSLESELGEGGFFVAFLVVAAVAQVSPLLRFSAGPLAAAGRVHLENE